MNWLKKVENISEKVIISSTKDEDIHMNKKVFVTDAWFPDYDELVKRVKNAGGTVVFASAKDEDTLIKEGSDAVCIVNTSAKCSAKFINALTNCKMIVRTGIGVDTIDVDAATSKNISVCNVPDYCLGEVANHAVTLALTVIRKIGLLNKEVSEGKWNNSELGNVPRLSNSTFGLLGFGGISKNVAERMKSFGVKVVAYDPFLPDEVFSELGVVRAMTLEDVYRQADAISIHMPLTKETKHVIDKEAIDKMKDGVFIINTARGALINEADLIEALKSGKVGGAGLDVVEQEPLPTDNKLNDFDNVVITPHAGYYSVSALPDLYGKVIDEVERALKGECNRMVLNKTALGV